MEANQISFLCEVSRDSRQLTCAISMSFPTYLSVDLLMFFPLFISQNVERFHHYSPKLFKGDDGIHMQLNNRKNGSEMHSGFSLKFSWPFQRVLPCSGWVSHKNVLLANACT